MNAAGLLQGNPVSLHVLDYGSLKVIDSGREIAICGYLIQTSAGESVIVDTGLPKKYFADAKAASDEDRLFDFAEIVKLEDENLPAAQLALAGLSPEDINLHILTHSHIDHIGGLEDFPQAPILVSSVERGLPKPLYREVVQSIDWPDQNYLEIDGDVEIGPGFHVLMVPGHTPGHLALMLELPETGVVILASDSIARPEEIDEKFSGAWNEAKAIDSADRLMSLKKEHDAFMIYGHSPEQWPTIKKAPEAYR